MNNFVISTKGRNLQCGSFNKAKTLYKNLYTMRSFLVTIFLLLSIVGDAQNYKLEYDVNLHLECSSSRFFGSMWYTTLKNATPQEVPAFNMWRHEGPNHVVSPTPFLISANEGPVTKIWINTQRQYGSGAGVWTTYCHENDVPIYVNPGITASTAAHSFTTADVLWHGLWGCWSEYCFIPTHDATVEVNEFKLTPDLSITSPNSPAKLIPINENITLQATAGFMPEIYKWQCSTPPLYSGYFSLRDFQNTNPININAKHVLHSSAESYIGSPLHFIIDYPGSASSEVFTMTVCLSSPHITKVEPIQPKCYGDKNGSAKIYFDRPLRSGETLNITVKNAGDVGFPGKNNISSLEADNSIKLDYNLGADQYTIGLNGSYKGVRTYTDGAGHRYTFPIGSPDPLSYTATKQNDVLCYGNNDGAIKLTATGGNKSYPYLFCYKKNWQTNFTSWQYFGGFTTHTLTGLDTGIYIIRVKDVNECVEKDGMNNEVVRIDTINQPKEPVKIENSEITEPLGYGRTDGKITVRIRGGSKKPDGSYNITWQKGDGTILTSVANADSGTYYQSVLQNIGKGKYTVTIKDDNFSKAASGATKTCMVVSDTFDVHEPPPIIINIVQQKNILCKGDSAAELAAHVTGGVPYTEGPTIPYEYQWFKREATDIDLGKTDSIATNLVAGDYVVKITDKNGIEKISDVFTVTEPDSLKIHFTTTVNSCKGTQNISATITGGTAPYHIEWPTGDTTTTINDIPETLCSKSPCMVEVTDVYGCEIFTPLQLIISGTITIDTAIIKNPSYYSSKDGSIQLTISKGTPPYTYRWSNGDITKDIENLAAGTYSLLITDDSGCIRTQTFTLQNPPRIIHVDGTPLGSNIIKTLCNGQFLNIDATIPDNAATYQWSSNNGFTANTPKVTLTATGEYWIKITDSRSVTASDTVIIKRSTADINARFLVSTQAFAGEKLTFVNISRPLPERIEWLIPNNPKIEIIQVNQELAQLIFKDTGTYIIGMKSIVGECEQTVTKKLIVVRSQQFDDIGITNNPFIKEFTIMPNPNTGQFNVKVVLQEQSKIRLRMMNITSSAIINDQELSGSSQYIIPYTISAASGAYILLLETPKGNQIQKIIIN